MTSIRGWVAARRMAGLRDMVDLAVPGEHPVFDFEQNGTLKVGSGHGKGDMVWPKSMSLFRP